MTYTYSSYVKMIHILQQLLYLHALYSPLLGHHELYYRNNYYVTEALYHSNSHVSMTYIYSSYVTMIHTVSTTTTQVVCYSNYYISMLSIYRSYVTMSYTVATTITSLKSYITAIPMSL